MKITKSKVTPKRVSQKRIPVTKKHYTLRLFVAGASTRSQQAILKVHQLCEGELKNQGKIEIIDIYQQPELARIHQIVATPTLLIVFPPPIRRIVGNLSKLKDLFIDLDLSTEGRVTL